MDQLQSTQVPFIPITEDQKLEKSKEIINRLKETDDYTTLECTVNLKALWTFTIDEKSENKIAHRNYIDGLVSHFTMELYEKIWKQLFPLDTCLSNGEPNIAFCKNLKYCVLIGVNCTTIESKFAKVLADSNMMKLYIKGLQHPKLLEATQVDVYSLSLGIVTTFFNLLYRDIPGSRNTLRELGGVQTLIPYLKEGQQRLFKPIVLGTLARLVDDKEMADVLRADKNAVRLLCDILSECLKTPEHVAIVDGLSWAADVTISTLNLLLVIELNAVRTKKAIHFLVLVIKMISINILRFQGQNFY